MECVYVSFTSCRSSAVDIDEALLYSSVIQYMNVVSKRAAHRRHHGAKLKVDLFE